MSNSAPRRSADISRDLQRQEEVFRLRTPEQEMGERILGYMRNVAIAISLVIPALGMLASTKRPGFHEPSGVQPGVEARENPGDNQDEQPQEQSDVQQKEIAGADDDINVASAR